jgi:hypothetical protein
MEFVPNPTGGLRDILPQVHQFIDSFTECSFPKMTTYRSNIEDGANSADEKGVRMPAENSEKTNMKQKVVHEFEELAIITLYLAFFFCALATYSLLLLDKFHISYFVYGTALLNALIIAKVILIGEALHAGTKFEGKALVYSAIWKAFVFGLLVFAFHILEEMIKHLVHGKDLAGAFHNIRIDELLSRTVIIFCTFIPLFAFRELRRVMGQDKFRAFFFHSTSALKSNP